MILAVWVPLLLPFLAARPARRLADALPPRAAAWTLATASAVLAVGTLCSLGLLTAEGLLQLPAVAALGHLSLPWPAADGPAAGLPAALAGAALAVLTTLALRTARLRRNELRTARAALGPVDPASPVAPAGPDTPDSPARAAQPGPTEPHRGDQHPDMRPPCASMRRARTSGPRQTTRTGALAHYLHALRRRAHALFHALLHPAGQHPLAVLDDDRADAFALPGRLRRPGRPGEPGRIVVTAGMLRALSAPERAALLAHERAHLAGRHHLFLALAEHAAAVHPALRPLRAPLGYHLERWADEVAAEQVGDRTVTARAVGRAALAASRSPRPARPGLAPAAHSGPVPRRVAALLQPRPAASGTGRRTAAALVLAACLALTTAATLDAGADLHHTVEAAQQEAGGPR
ncbi:M56 family metallopeptidase [Kitasatospora sp. NPDC091207]|uniref:M56 family metallopeptidase n=1 Tax=Kitasatospora sp. NPDC091207 TaxID=3364083 RepID=UPI00381A13BF